MGVGLSRSLHDSSSVHSACHVDDALSREGAGIDSGRNARANKTPKDSQGRILAGTPALGCAREGRAEDADAPRRDPRDKGDVDDGFADRVAASAHSFRVPLQPERTVAALSRGGAPVSNSPRGFARKKWLSGERAADE